MQEKVTNILKQLKEALQRIYGDNLRGVYLYGSYANGEADPESDIDIVIVLRDFSDYWAEVQRTGEVISKLSLECGISISPVRMREAHWMLEDSPFLNNVRRESVLL